MSENLTFKKIVKRIHFHKFEHTQIFHKFRNILLIFTKGNIIFRDEKMFYNFFYNFEKILLSSKFIPLLSLVRFKVASNLENSEGPSMKIVQGVTQLTGSGYGELKVFL